MKTLIFFWWASVLIELFIFHLSCKNGTKNGIIISYFHCHIGFFVEFIISFPEPLEIQTIWGKTSKFEITFVKHEFTRLELYLAIGFEVIIDVIVHFFSIVWDKALSHLWVLHLLYSLGVLSPWMMAIYTDASRSGYNIIHSLVRSNMVINDILKFHTRKYKALS